MRKAHTLIIALLAAPLMAQAANYATCLLDEMPGLQNDNAAYAAVQVCTSRYPRGMDTIPQGAGRGIFSYDSGAECALDKSRDTQSRIAAFQIRLACDRLYNKQCSSLSKEFGLNCN